MKITVCIFLLTVSGALGKSVTRKSGKKPWTLDESLATIVGDISATWLSDYEIVYRNRTTGDIMIYDMNATRVYVESSVLNKYNCTAYSFSYDGKYLLMRYDDQKTFRHSVISKYVVYSLEEKTYTDLAKKASLQHAEWSPADHDIVYIQENDIHIATIGRGSYRITRTGIPGEVFNGICDWMYEEEIRGRATSLAMSPDGQLLIYLSLDDRGVRQEQFMEYGEPGSLQEQYANPVKIRYPKPGTPLPEYQVFLFSKKDNSTRLLASSWSKPPGRDISFGYEWVTSSSFTMTFANRVQNETETDYCRVKDGSCKTIFEDKNPKGWANFDSPLVSVEGDKFVARVRQKVGNDEYYHVHLISIDGSKRTALTNGTFMVRQILSWDELTGLVYYKASEVGQPATDHVYAVNTDGKQNPFCITCQMKSPEGISCKAGKINFNKVFSYGIGSCRGPTPLTIGVYKWKASGSLTEDRLLYENRRLRQILQDKLEPEHMNFQVKVTDTIEADVRLYVPPGMDTTGKKKYPLIIYVYGGPDNPQVKDDFLINWSWYLTTNRSVIYGIIDGRGTGRKGTEMMYAVYRAFGTVEMNDQRTATKYLRDNLKFIDGEKIGIWGWSYGGYAAAKVLLDDVEGVFKCGVSVAPVSDWIYYNAGYTERYMDLPAANMKAYNKSSLLHNVENMKKKQYLLMHGTADDNVHYQHAMHFAKVLLKNNVLFMQEGETTVDEPEGRRSVVILAECMQDFQTAMPLLCLSTEPGEDGEMLWTLLRWTADYHEIE